MRVDGFVDDFGAGDQEGGVQVVLGAELSRLHVVVLFHWRLVSLAANYTNRDPTRDEILLWWVLSLVLLLGLMFWSGLLLLDVDCSDDSNLKDSLE